MLSSPYTVAILTCSDKASQCLRVDESGPCIREIMEKAGFAVTHEKILPDERPAIASQLRQWSDGAVNLILTTGGTGLAPRDCTPEATLDVATRLVPGIAEAIRHNSLTITNRAMLSRAVSAICNHTLIINLPGSPKAVRESLEYVLPVLEHGLETLSGTSRDCAST